MRCDLRLPWRVSLGKHRLPFLRDALDDYDCCWLRGVSPATELRAIERERLRISIGQGIPLGEAARRVPGLVALPVSNWPYPEQVSEPGLRNRLRAWQACLDQHDTEAVLVPPEQPGNAPRSPIGSLFVALSDDSRLEIRAVSDRPTLATGRFYGLLDDQGIHAWARTKLDEWARRDGLSLVELSAPFKPNPNVLAARPLVNRFVAPQNASTGAVSLQSARVRAHPKTGQPVIECSGHSGSYVVLAPGSANLQAGDPLTRLLLMTGFHESPTRDQRAVDVPTAHEFAEPRHMPRVRLPHGALMRERRTLLTRDLTGLLRASGAERFSAWQRLARKFDWARRLRVSVAGGEPMTVNRDSPLGVEALLKGVNPKTPFVAVEDAGDCGRVSVSGQDTFLAEMVLPFARQAR
jgi:hypothetical protein